MIRPGVTVHLNFVMVFDLSKHCGQKQIFLNTSRPLQLRVSRQKMKIRNGNRRVKKRRHFINHKRIVRAGSFFSVFTLSHDLKMGRHLAADRQGACNIHVFQSKFFHIFRNERRHRCEIAACGVTGNVNLFRVAAELFDVSDRPCNRSGCVKNRIFAVRSRKKSVIDRHNEKFLIEKFCRNMTIPCGKSAAVEPNDDWSVWTACFRMVHIQAAPFLCVRCVARDGKTFRIVRNVRRHFLRKRKNRG